MINKKTKKRYDFFTIKYLFNDETTYDLRRLNLYLNQVYNEVNNDTELKPIKCADQLFVGISGLQKVFIQEGSRNDYYWLIHFSKIDTEKESSVSNVKQDIVRGRTYYASSEDEGPVTDTVVIINPFNNIIIIPTNRDGFSKNLLKSFLYKTVKQKGAEISVLVDTSSYNKAELMDNPQEIELTISKIANIDQIKNPNTTAKKAQNLMLSAESDKMYLKLNSRNKFNGSLKNIISGFKTFINDDEVSASTLRIVGEHDYEPQIIDLISERVVFIDDHVLLNEDGKLTVESMKESIQRAYKSKRKQLDLYGKTLEILKERESDGSEETN